MKKSSRVLADSYSRSESKNTPGPRLDDYINRRHAELTEKYSQERIKIEENNSDIEIMKTNEMNSSR